jgi:hypothetical protein
MIITSRQKNGTSINIPNINHKQHIKYLGIYIDEHLNWHTHIAHVSNKIAKNIGILYKLRYYLEFKMLKQLYYTLIYPYLNYAIMSWGNTYKSSLLPLAKKQNKCIRSIFFIKNNENLDPYYNLLDILKIHDIITLKIATFTHKILKNPFLVPVLFSDFLLAASSVHSHNTRYAANKNLHRTAIRTNYGKFTFKYLSSVVWESIPLHIKQLPYFSFKKQFKIYLLACYNA